MRLSAECKAGCPKKSRSKCGPFFRCLAFRGKLLILFPVKSWFSASVGANNLLLRLLRVRQAAGMGTRRRARERAVQFLYQYDLNPTEKLEEAMNHFFESQRLAALREDGPELSTSVSVDAPPPTGEEAALRVFAEPLIRGVLEHREVIDAEIQKYALNWDVRRMAAVDRNILRLAVYEMRHRQDIPPVVSINEAVDIAKRFSTQESGKFVNGILDKIKGELMRSARAVTE